MIQIDALILDRHTLQVVSRSFDVSAIPTEETLLGGRSRDILTCALLFRSRACWIYSCPSRIALQIGDLFAHGFELLLNRLVLDIRRVLRVEDMEGSRHDDEDAKAHHESDEQLNEVIAHGGFLLFWAKGSSGGPVRSAWASFECVGFL